MISFKIIETNKIVIIRNTIDYPNRYKAKQQKKKYCVVIQTSNAICLFYINIVDYLFHET